MKKIVLVFSLLLASMCAVSASAQSIKVGATAGLNMSKPTNNIFDAGNRYGWYIGPKVKLSLPLGFGVDAAAVYNQRRLALGNIDAEIFRSIEVPINVRYSIGLGSIASVYGATGPQFGFKVGDNKWADMVGYFEDFKEDNVNVSWNFGVGITLLKHFEVGVGYNLAVSKYAEIIGYGPYNKDYTFRNNTFQVQAAYYF